MNGVKQGGVLSHIPFAVYTNGLLKRLEDTEVGCQMRSRFTGAIAYVDNNTLLAPCKSALPLMVKVCEFVKVMLVNLTYYLMVARAKYYILERGLLMLCSLSFC